MDGIGMKATHIKIEPGESVELSIYRPGVIVRHYSSVGVGTDQDRCPEQKHSVSFGVTMNICGPATLCIVEKDKD